MLSGVVISPPHARRASSDGFWCRHASQSASNASVLLGGEVGKSWRLQDISAHGQCATSKVARNGEK